MIKIISENNNIIGPIDTDKCKCNGDSSKCTNIYTLFKINKMLCYGEVKTERKRLNIGNKKSKIFTSKHTLNTIKKYISLSSKDAINGSLDIKIRQLLMIDDININILLSTLKKYNLSLTFIDRDEWIDRHELEELSTIKYNNNRNNGFVYIRNRLHKNDILRFNNKLLMRKTKVLEILKENKVVNKLYKNKIYKREML